jgi:hypothetical protein
MAMSKLPKYTNDIAALYQSVFATPNGKKVWEDLTRELNPDELFVKGDAEATHINIGKRDAYIYINQLLRIDTND